MKMIKNVVIVTVLCLVLGYGLGECWHERKQDPVPTVREIEWVDPHNRYEVLVEPE